MQTLKSIGNLLLGLLQLMTYATVTLVGLAAGIVAFVMGMGATVSEPARLYYSEHFLVSASIFMGANLVAMLCLWVRQSLQHRWQHLGI